MDQAHLGAVSAFGRSGTNAHVVIEEYRSPVTERPVPWPKAVTRVVVPLSARTPEQLQQKASELRDYIRTPQEPAVTLPEIAYTLQVGREAMAERAGFIAGSAEELADKLEAYLRGEQQIEDVYRGQVRRNRESSSWFSSDADLQETIDKWIVRGHLSKLADLWVKGLALDWNRFYGAVKPRRISLPLYPFARERHWIDTPPQNRIATTARTTAAMAGLAESHQQTASVSDAESLHAGIVQKLKQMLVRVNKLSLSQIDEHEALSVYGIDSITINELNAELAGVFGEISRTLFFEYRTLAELAAYFTREHEAECSTWAGLTSPPAVARASEMANILEPSGLSSGLQRSAALRDRASGGTQASMESRRQEPIAIIGISGMYPHAATIDEFWTNLESGRNCIGEIPPDRWPMEGFYEPDEQEAIDQGKSYSRWGGFLDRFAEFDALFFGISPRDALNMDPQERLFLQAAWTALEDSGYTRRTLQSKFGRKVGVFAGITRPGYSLYGTIQSIRDAKFFPTTSFSSVANRLSYFLDLSGPSMPIDTMCSSSLTAIHEACEHIHRGECHLAFAGGVNLNLHPSSYIGLCAQHMLSTDGLCRSFGVGGNGFVPGEGVGVVLLKPLSSAIEDDDTIHGLILATNVNHGGKTNGYTVPNPKAHSELIRHALDKAGINAREVSYIEAHGTGTALGDPIEITGLQQAFRADTAETGFCKLGSAKSNIGHLDAAAGMAGLTKVLLQMKHRKIVPSLHASALNPNIDFQRTPFELNQSLSEWEQPVVNGEPRPRIAGISSFGAGGANAHVIVREYTTVERPAAAASSPSPSSPHHASVVIPLSARTEEQLQQKARELLDFFRRQEPTVTLSQIAYTLQVGREAMEERLGFIINSVEQLLARLQGFINGERDLENTYRGQVQRNKEALSLFADAELQEAVDKWMRRGKVSKLLELWVRGLDLDWDKLYDEVRPTRVGLPTYPFSRDRYWIDMIARPGTTGDGVTTSAVLHPLLHTNTSTFERQSYGSTFTGDELFLSHHRVNGEKVLPAAAYLEMVRAAMERALPEKRDADILELHNTVWAQPIVVAGNKRVSIELFASGERRVDYRIHTQDGDHEVVHCQGQAAFSRKPIPVMLDVERLKAQMGQGKLEPNSVYQAFAGIGLSYGPAFRSITSIHKGERQILAELRLPEVVDTSWSDYLLHPSLLDGALQAAIGLFDDLPRLSGPFLPFALASLRIVAACGKEMLAWVRYAPGGRPEDKVVKLDIDLCDPHGNVCVQLQELSTRGSAPKIGTPRELDDIENTLLAVPTWKSGAPADSAAAARFETAERRIILCDLPQFDAGRLEALVAHSRCVALSSLQLNLPERYSHYALACFEVIRNVLEDKTLARVLVQIVAANEPEGALIAGLSGLLKTAALENPRVAGQIILTDPQITPDLLARQLDENRAALPDSLIRYEHGTRQVSHWQEVHASRGRAAGGLNQRGVYLITGGLGGLGILFAREMLQQAPNSRIILVGRSESSADQQAIMGSLPSFVEYRQLDVADLLQVRQLMIDIRKDHGRLDGILHCAGTIQDNFILKKSREEFNRVLLPKVTGTFNLDEASKDMGLDFLVLFSSIAAAHGNVGQADYAAANGFMNWFAGYRNQLVATGMRKGRTVSINWPLWLEGGMRIDQASLDRMRQATGVRPMQTTTGMRVFHHSLQSRQEQILAVEGDVPKMRATLPDRAIEAAGASRGRSVAAAGHADTLRLMEDYVREQLCGALKLPVHQIDLQAPFEKYGIDSILAMNLTNQLEKTFGSLPKTLFFEFQTVHELSLYLVDTFPEGVAALSKATGNGRLALAETPVELQTAPRLRRDGGRFGTRNNLAGRTATEPIAIIGLSGRYPEAADVASYWRNLRNGKNCIVEIPESRWNWREYYSEERGRSGHHYSRWGGFIPGVDEFDPRFFNISPADARFIDPQERLFLQQAWMAVEDAGYTRAGLQIPCDFGLAGQVGVYVGVMYGEYQLFGAEASVRGKRMAFAGNLANIANRVSYVLNVHGPSMTVDSMCSSSLTAIHLACQDLKQARTDMAIAGGVNVSIHPNKYLMLSAGQFISGDDECRSFGEGGDGYIPGEGVGAVVLKRLSEAEDDGNHIYGVIRGSAINHGGRTNRYTVPNPVAQAGAISLALAEAGINARQVSYIEAHGTGTRLGDPIEIAALHKAFQRDTPDTGFCLIGSAKSNIGHCESAAGIAGLTKILLQMQHREIVPSLHSETLNPHIEFAKTPFVVNQTLRTWEQPVIEGWPQSRIAGLSSFGAGGSNAHIVVEEHCAPPRSKQYTATTGQHEKFAIPLSAKTAEQLRQKACDLQTFIRNETEQPPDLEAMAYTLQAGREAMEERLGILAGTIDELAEKLEAYVAGEGAGDIFQQQSRSGGEAFGPFDRSDLKQVVDKWIAEKKLAKLLDLWVKGHDLDWDDLYGLRKPRRITLPAYPFARERYWFDTTEREVDAMGVASEIPPPAAPAIVKQLPVMKSPWLFSRMGDDGSRSMPPKEKMERFLKQELALRLQKPVEEIDGEQSFFESGLTSLDVTSLVEKAGQLLQENVSPAAAFEHTDIRRFAAYLAKTFPTEIDALAVTPKEQTASATQKRPKKGTVSEEKTVRPAPDGVMPELAGVADGTTIATRIENERIPPILPIDRNELHRMPLSFAQERLWFIDQLEPESAIYNIAGAVSIKGPLDLPEMERALNLVIARHDTLRTVFHSEGGKARQQIQDVSRFRLERVNLNGDRDYRDRRTRAREICQLEAATPFDLALGPLIRGKIIRVGPEEHVLMLNMHHIISDAWSMGVLTKELSLIMQGRSDDLPALPIQYVDYSLWQRKWLEQSGVLERQLDYWQEKLAGMPDKLNLDTDYPRPAVQRFAGATETFALDARLTRALKSVARGQNCSLYVVLLAAFNATLYRYSGQEDICIGSPIANRQYGGTAGLIGMFANTIVLRSRINPARPFVEYLMELHKCTSEVHANQDAPFEKVVDRLGLKREANRNPMIQHAFVQQQNPDFGTYHGQAIEQFDFDRNVSVFDQIVEVFDRGATIAGNWTYSTHLYRRSRIDAFIAAYARILTTVARHPDRPIGEISLLTGAQQRQIKQRWTSRPVQMKESLQTRLKRIFKRNGDEIALIAGDRQFSHAEVGGHCRRIAAHLQRLGLPAACRVGVRMPDGAERILIYLGLLMSGRSIVPVPVGEPPAHAARLISRSGVRLVIGVQADTRLDVRHVSAKDLFGGEIESSWPAHKGGVGDEVLVETLWDAAGGLIEFIYTQADLMSWLSIDQMQINRQGEVCQSMWWHLLQGRTFRLDTILESRLNSRRDRLYHLREMGVGQETSYRTSMAGVLAQQSMSLNQEGPPAYVDGGALFHPKNAPATITEAMLRAGEAEAKGLTVVDEKGVESHLSYQRLLDLGTRVTRGLQKNGLASRAAVILQCENLADHFIAFWGCLLGGYIPVSVAVPPVYTRDNPVIQKMAGVWKLLGEPVVICNRGSHAALTALASADVLHGMQALEVETLKTNAPSRQLHTPSGDDVAFYQLSAGSTGVSKCIQIKHGGAIAHCESVRQFEGHSERDVSLNWMPVDHVVAVLTVHLKSVYLRCHDIQVKTDYITGNPLNLLRLIEKFGVTYAFSPNFGYKLVSESLKSGDVHDLSSVRYFVNGGEQVNRGVLEEFLDKTAALGFDPRAMQPAFGMAESCTGITYNKNFSVGSGYMDVGGTEFISLGTVLSGVEIRIADGKNTLLREQQTGRLQIRGAVVTPGYYGDPDANKAAFTEDAWFNSGDLGFICEGQLYITGREKEMIIVRGANIYCHEVEALVGEIATVESGHVGVFPILKGEAGTEGFGIAYVGDPGADTIREIKGRVSQRLGINPDVIIPLEEHQFPKTTSGKIQRSQLARQLIDGDYSLRLQQVDIEEANENTLPDWFYEGFWSKADVDRNEDAHPPLNLIVFSEQDWAAPEPGTPHARHAVIRHDAIALELPRLLQQWDLLAREHLVLLDLVTAGAGGPASMLPVMQLLMQAEYEVLAVTWIALYEGADSCVVNGERALLKSFTQERPESHTVVCELDEHVPWQEALGREVQAGLRQSRDVRYRDGARFVYRLQHVLFDSAQQRSAAGNHAAGLSIVLGGLGGIGRVASELLLRRENQHVLVTGRSEPEVRQVAWRDLVAVAEVMAGRVTYIEHDLINDDDDELCRQIRDIEKDSGLVLSTIVQAIGSNAREGSIQTNEPGDYTRSIRENDRVTRVLETLARDRPGIQVIEIGSVNGSFGGSQVSAYAYRKGYELGRLERFLRLGIAYTNIQQTMWTGTGMSAGKKNLGLRRGYMSIGRAQGMQSLAMIINHGKSGLYYTGIDGRHKEMQSYLTMSSRRRLITPDDGIPGLEQRLALFLRSTSELPNPLTVGDLVGSRQLTLDDEHGDVVDQYRRGRLSIRSNRRAEPLRTSIVGKYDDGWRIDLEAGDERHSGYQFEAREIASVIRRLPEVLECHMIHRWDENDREELVACFVAEAGETTLIAAEVQAYVRQNLPLHLQPSRFVVVEELPRTRGGLVDSVALERMACGHESVQARVAPRNEVESGLAAIWAQVLSLDPERIGVDDSFFELGGNSLLATQLVSRIRGHFQVELQVKNLFAFNTIAGIATIMKAVDEGCRPVMDNGVAAAELEEMTL
jgi:acyl transferase domain-containing protein/acyl-CoA synthetase (AMP-forming)/AMP-acid ligase II